MLLMMAEAYLMLEGAEDPDIEYNDYDEEGGPWLA